MSRKPANIFTSGLSATCIGCGCDDLHACENEATGEPCHWLELARAARRGVCSACPDLLAAWHAGDRELHVPVGPRHG